MSPCIPSSWSDFSIVWRFGGTRYEIAVSNPEGRCRGIAEAELDGVPVDAGAIPLEDDGRTHQVRLVMGEKRELDPAITPKGADFSARPPRRARSVRPA